MFRLIKLILIVIGLIYVAKKAPIAVEYGQTKWNQIAPIFKETGFAIKSLQDTNQRIQKNYVTQRDILDSLMKE